MGSPPHTRGILRASQLLISSPWFTPAYAGNTKGFNLDRIQCEVHPRIRGEYSALKESGSLEFGSPPHTRGIL